MVQKEITYLLVFKQIIHIDPEDNSPNTFNKAWSKKCYYSHNDKKKMQLLKSWTKLALPFPLYASISWRWRSPQAIYVKHELAIYASIAIRFD